jgi:hypothetical protein
VDPKSDGAKRDWVAIYDECASVLYQVISYMTICYCLKTCLTTPITDHLISSCLFYQEIDYMKEAFNAEKFAENFKKLDYVKVPEIYWAHTTPQVSSTQKI